MSSEQTSFYNLFQQFSLFKICKKSALTLDDEKREISKMICSFINKIELTDKNKLEQYLNFFSEARSSFSNLDDVINLLIHVSCSNVYLNFESLITFFNKNRK